MLKRVLAPALIVGLAVATFVAAGCSSGSSNRVEVQIESGQDQAVAKDGLDPLTRGKVRREILRDMEENLKIWLSGDTENLDKVFTKEALGLYRERLKDLKAKDQDKVRIHENQDLEVVELSSGTQGTVKYRFAERSYFISTKTNQKVKDLNDDEVEIEIRVVKEEGRWKIQTMFGSGDSIL